MKGLFAATSAVALLVALPVMAQGTTGTTPPAGTAPPPMAAPPQSAAPSPNVGAPSVSQSERQFVTQAANDGMAEVKLGQLAQQKGRDTDVKNFGRKMVDDHSKANADLKQVADKNGVALPNDLDPKNQATYDRLSKLNGAEFDRAYMQDMVADHRKDVSDFQREANAAQNPDLRSFVQRTTPVLQQHLALAQQVQDSLTVSGSSMATDQRTGGQTMSRHAAHRTSRSSDNAMTQQLNREEAARLQSGNP
jgi:putative membrane protein